MTPAWILHSNLQLTLLCKHLQQVCNSTMPQGMCIWPSALTGYQHHVSYLLMLHFVCCAWCSQLAYEGWVVSITFWMAVESVLQNVPLFMAFRESLIGEPYRECYGDGSGVSTGA
jgi:hypothetical protein